MDVLENLGDSSANYEELEESNPMSFDWEYTTTKDDSLLRKGFSLSLHPDSIKLYVAYKDNLPEEMDLSLKNVFKQYFTPEGDVFYYYTYGNVDPSKICYVSDKTSKPISTIVDDKYEHSSPRVITVENIVEILSSKKTLIYTGAGLSINAGIPDLKDLEELLGIDKYAGYTRIDSFTRTLISDPLKLKNILLGISKLFYKSTTPAHIAIKDLQNTYGFDIATENLDFAHEQTGVSVIRREFVQEKLTNEYLKNLDCIITVGLRSDASNVLERFKDLNPKGTLVALNIAVPPYMRETDFYLEGDVQKTLLAVRDASAKK